MGFRHARLPNTVRIFIMIYIFFLAACSDGSISSNNYSSNTGELSFKIIYQGSAEGSRSYASVIDCSAEGVETVEASVYDGNGDFLAGGGPWDCNSGQGTIRSVPVGANRTILIFGKNVNGNIVFRGKKSDIQVEANGENDAGLIECYAFVPILEAPANHSVVDANTVELVWNDIIGANEYQVILSENDNLSSPIIEASSTASTFIPSGISNTKSYYWCVLAIDDYGNKGIGSQMWSFTGSESNAPSLIMPVDGTVIDVNEAELKWHSVNGISEYRVIISEDNDLANPIVNETTPNCEYYPTALSNLSTYYWQVLAIDEEENSEIGSQIWTFHGADVFVPVLLSPKDKSVVDIGNIELRWGEVAGAAEYRVIVMDNSDLSNPIIDITTTSTMFSPTGLSNAKSYNWQVYAINSFGDTGIGSAIWQFIDHNAFVPILQSPEHNAVVEANTVTLNWEEVEEANEYRIIVSENSNLTDPVINATSASTSFSPSGLSNAKTYYWEIYAVDLYGNIGFASDTWIFNTHSWTAVATGREHTVGIRPNGTLWTWGSNYNGQLGLGTAVIKRNSPTRVGTESDWAFVAAGEFHTVAIKDNGELWVWGGNDYGQLGLGNSGDNTERYTPTRVGNNKNWRSVDAGLYHTVAVTINDELWVWGYHAWGQLGLGMTDDNHIDRPTRLGNDSNWDFASAGGHHTLATKPNGQLWAWGHNSFGQLGLGDSGDDAHRLFPVRVGSDSDWSAVTLGAGHTIGIKYTGELWAWGANYGGTLGIGDDTNNIISEPTRVGTHTNVASIAAGHSHTVAVKTNGELWAWGDNSSYQLGIPDDTDYNIPTRVGDETNWTSVAAHSLHSLAIKSNGELWAWGNNEYGQLGIGDAADDQISVPTQVSDP